MRKTYQRGALGVLICYGILNVCSFFCILFFLGICVGFFVLSNRESLPMLLMQLDLSVINMEFLSWFAEAMGAYDFILLGSVLGAVIGLSVGSLVLRKIMSGSSYVPIPKRTLRAGEFLIYLIITFGLWGIGAAFGNLPEFFGVTGFSDLIFEKACDSRAVYYLYAVLGAPLLEELIFRKVFLDRTHVYGETVAAFASALLFALFHGNCAQFFLAFGIGLCGAVCYQRTGRLIYSVLLHAVINFTACLPEIALLFGEDLSLIWNVCVPLLAAAGLLAIPAYRDRDILRLELPREKDANRAAFGNPGMKIVMIAGGISTALMSVYTMVLDLSSGEGVLSLLLLIPAAGMAVTLILIQKKAGKHTGSPTETGEELMRS